MRFTHWRPRLNEEHRDLLLSSWDCARPGRPERHVGPREAADRRGHPEAPLGRRGPDAPGHALRQNPDERVAARNTDGRDSLRGPAAVSGAGVTGTGRRPHTFRPHGGSRAPPPTTPTPS